MFAFDISTRFACSTLLFRSMPFADVLKAIAKTKLGYVDLWSTPGILQHVDPERDSVTDITAQLSDYNLRPASVSAYATFGDDLLTRLDFAAGIGAPTVIATAPSREYERHEATDDVRALGRAAQERGVTLALANQIDTWLDEPSEIASFLDDVGHPRIQLSVTPPHARLVKTTLRALLQAAGNRVGHTCLWSASSEMNSADDLGPAEDQVPESGTVDFGALIATLEENNYFGMYTFLWGGTQDWSEGRTVEAINSARSHILKVSKR